MSTATIPDFKRASGLLKQASDATRLQILLSLAEGDRNVTELGQDVVYQSQPALSHHLNLLKLAGLVEPTRRGQHNYYRVTDLGRSLVAAVEHLSR